MGAFLGCLLMAIVIVIVGIATVVVINERFEDLIVELKRIADALESKDKK